MSQSAVVKKNSKVILGEDEFAIDGDMSIEELLSLIKEDNPAYSNATEENCFIDDEGNLVVSQPKSKTNGL